LAGGTLLRDTILQALSTPYPTAKQTKEAAATVFNAMAAGVARLHSQISEAHVAFGDTVDTAIRTRYNNAVKKSTKSLSVKFKELANILKKKIAEHQDLVKDIFLERKENKNIMKQTTMSLESNLEDALRREKARAIEEWTIRTSELEDHIQHVNEEDSGASRFSEGYLPGEEGNR
jgi:hypothetical protein